MRFHKGFEPHSEGVSAALFIFKGGGWDMMLEL